ncbi:MAG: L,D-transpeptidase [Planctomycetaceae bacterium]
MGVSGAAEQDSTPRLKAGQSLKVIKGPFGDVDLSDYEITVHCHGHYVYRFPVGIGKDGSTPIGTFTVEDKVVNPQYNGPEGTIAADDPANPIGERWISLGGGYGIHGTIDPDSIGKSESRGCIRMHNKDVEIVYDLLTVGSEVVIQR